MDAKYYYGTKCVMAWPSSVRGTDGILEGYTILYGDGYQSWAPKDLFEADYRTSGNLTFGHALLALRNGKRVARSGWNGKGLFVVLMGALSLPPYNTQDTNKKVNDRTAKWIGEDQPLHSQPYFALYNTNNNVWQPGWVGSTSDLLAEDWYIVGDNSGTPT